MIENFFIDDAFYREVEDYLITEGLEKEDIEEFPDVYFIEVIESSEEPVFQLTPSSLTDILENSFDERKSDDGDEFDRVQKLLSECVDFDKLNANVPRLYYRSNNVYKLTKAELLEACD